MDEAQTQIENVQTVAIVPKFVTKIFLSSISVNKNIRDAKHCHYFGQMQQHTINQI